MDVHQHVFFLSFPLTPEKRLLAAGVGRVGTEGKRNSRRLHRADLLEQLQGVLSLSFLPLLCRGIDHSIGEYPSKPCLLRSPGHILHVKVHVNETRSSRSRHFHRSKKGAVVAHFTSEPFLERPDLLLKPLLKLKVIGISPEESHREMRMRVDQTRNQHLTSTIDNLVLSGPLSNAHVPNGSTLIDANRGVPENLSISVLRDNPVAPFQEQSRGSTPLLEDGFARGLLLKACTRHLEGLSRSEPWLYRSQLRPPFPSRKR